LTGWLGDKRRKDLGNARKDVGRRWGMDLGRFQNNFLGSGTKYRLYAWEGLAVQMWEVRNETSGTPSGIAGDLLE
jgi:hypothetical protein